MRDSFDLVVVGTGEGASGVTTQCREAGWRVAVVDDQPYGGTCTLRGCDPKKVLIGVAELVDWQRRMRGSGVDGAARIDWPALMRFKRTFTEPVPAEREKALTAAGVTTFHGAAHFATDDCIVIASVTGETHELQARHFVIASGAEPVRLNVSGEEHVRTSTDFLDLATLPARIAFIGAGYISFEFAHLVQRAGAQAIMLGRGAALGHFDQDLVARLVAHSRAIGIDLRTNAVVTAVEATGSGYRVIASTDAGPVVVEADLVVHGAGRVPRTAHLELERGHIATDARGAVTVNEFLQSTTNPRVYAAGDCALPPGSLPLTPVAEYEALAVASNLVHGNATMPDYRGVPSVVFTGPPLAGVGLTEAEAHREKRAIRVKCDDAAAWFSNRRVREPTAMFKTVVDADTDRILGAHLLGPAAAEVINIFALAVRHDLTVRDLTQMIYAYPTNTFDVRYMF